MAHTPTPWRVGRYGGIYPIGNGAMIVSANTKSGYLPYATDNEAFIVQAINSHDKLQADRDALLTACKDADVVLTTLLDVHGCLCSGENETWEKIRAAIAQAEKEG